MNSIQHQPNYRNMKLMNYYPIHSPLESFFRDTLEAFVPLFETNGSDSSEVPVEWFKDDTHYFARIDLPGFSREDLSLEFESDTVTLSMSKKTHDSEEAKRFQRQIRVPDGVDGNDASAELKDGVLTLTLPKTPERKPVHIEIA